MKLLLYCTKGKELLWFNHKYSNGNRFFMDGAYNRILDDCPDFYVNGKIVAECDFEVEKITYNYLGNPFYDFYGMQLHTKTLKESELSQLSKINSNELRKYLLRTEDDYVSPLEVGYAIHIKNLHIFDKPKELSEYYRYYSCSYNPIQPIKVAPQNMMYAYNFEVYDEYILISIRPEWLCKILNGEKTIEVRKKVLKEML